MAQQRDPQTRASHSPQGLQPQALQPWVRPLVHWMDSALRVPGTQIRLGLDALVGFFFPGAGDAVSALPGLLLLIVAFQRRLPAVLILRMLLNIAVDLLLGAVPFLGDVYDVAFRSNERNLALLERTAASTRPARALDYVVVSGALLAVVLLAALPLVALWLLVRALGG